MFEKPMNEGGNFDPVDRWLAENASGRKGKGDPTRDDFKNADRHLAENLGEEISNNDKEAA